jgi:hypothetical protein
MCITRAFPASDCDPFNDSVFTTTAEEKEIIYSRGGANSKKSNKKDKKSEG